MTKIDPRSSEAQAIIESFSEHVVWLLSAYRIFSELFEDREIETALRSAGESFFTDLNRILQNYALLQCAKISDRESTFGKDNLTVDFMVDRIDWPQEATTRLLVLRDEIWRFRSKIIDARNKILGHIDLKTALLNRVLGAFDAGEDRSFLENLQEICDITFRVAFAKPFGEVSLGLPGDVLDFKKSLRMANAFRTLLDESTGDAKLRLFAMIDT